jgi:esterase/lipase superfamily enzyme
LLAREAFLKLLRLLRDDYKIEKINVLAHSMGNLIVLDALANEERTQNPLRISELILAAPDVDSDYFRQTAPIVRKITSGMTLYCSAYDKAMITSRGIAKAARAGDVPAGGPIVMPGIETIDVSALGNEFLGINHDVFASTRSVMNDIKGILNSGLRPPDSRGEARGVPEGAEHPKYWRYPN